jgi:hypothetical protein
MNKIIQSYQTINTVDKIIQFPHAGPQAPMEPFLRPLANLGLLASVGGRVLYGACRRQCTLC